MLRAVSHAVTIRVLVFLLPLLPACGDNVKQYKTAAGLRGQIEMALRDMEAD